MEGVMCSFRIILVSAALGAGMSPACAAVMTYTSQAAFDAAVSSETTLGFSEGDSDDHYHVAANPYIQSGITFSDNVTAADDVDGGTPILFLIGSAATPTYGEDFLSFQNTDIGISADITMSGITALGFKYASYIVGGPATVAVNGGAPIAITVTDTPSFIGFTSTTPLTDIRILFPTGISFDLTSLSYATANAPITGAVPEPASWVMFIGGFGVAGGALRRRQRTRASFA